MNGEKENNGLLDLASVLAIHYEKISYLYTNYASFESGHNDQAIYDWYHKDQSIKWQLDTKIRQSDWYHKD